MRVISGEPPRAVLVDGMYYPVKTDFRVWLEFARLLETEDGVHATVRALDLCYIKKRPASLKKAFFALVNFFLCDIKTDGGKGRAERIMSFDKDEELIYASFLSEYSIDLSKEEMHWWQFMALLKCLGPDTALSRVMSIRARKPSDIKNPAMRRNLLRQKRLYALDNETFEAGDVLAELFKAEEMI